MKKQIFSLILALTMLVGLATIPVSAAYATGVVLSAPAGTGVVPELIPVKTATADELKAYRDSVISIGASVTLDGLTGVGGGTSTPADLTDGVWKAGKWNNARFTFNSGEFYDKTGAAGVQGENGAIYTQIYTLNLGAVKSVSSVGYLAPIAFAPQAADIYVSEDGVNWTLVAYYDHVGSIIAGKATCNNRINLTSAEGADVWKDSANNALMDGLIIYDLPAAYAAQYVKIAATAGVRTATVTSYAVGSGISVTDPMYASEILVFGGDYVAPAPVATTIAMDGVQTKSIAGTDSFDARFVASVEKAALENASAIKLNFVATYGSEKVEKVITINTVYNSFLAGDDVITADADKAFALFLLEAIPNGTSVTFTVTPEIVYNDNTSAVGAAATFVFPTV